MGNLRLSLLPGLARRGALRARVEAVRLQQDLRSRELGAALSTWAVKEARRPRCALKQPTTDTPRRTCTAPTCACSASHEGDELLL